MNDHELISDTNLEALRDEALGRLTIEEVNWAVQRLAKPDKKELLRLVGLRLDPKYMKAGYGPLVQTRLQNAHGDERWDVAAILRERCLSEFASSLGLSFENPSYERLAEAIPIIVTRSGSTLVKLTLVVALHEGATAAPHITRILSQAQWVTTSPPDDAPVNATLNETETPVSAIKTNVGTTPTTLLLPLQKMRARADSAMDDSDATYYSNLLFMGEMITKVVALSLVACIDPERDDNLIAYATQHKLVRADSIGSWSTAIQDLTTAPVFRLLDGNARPFHSSMTQRFGNDSEAWQRVAIDKLNQAAACFPTLGAERAIGKTSLAQWFQHFAALRNKTRGHGADLVSWQSKSAGPLSASMQLITDNLESLHWPWFYVHKTAAGKSKIHSLGGTLEESPLDITTIEHPGVYVVPGSEARLVRLLSSDADLSDFYLPNGDAQEPNGRYEELSYISGQKKWADLASYIRPPRELPVSETHGSAELRAVGNVLTNLPEVRTDYVRREELEGDLQRVLSDSRHPVVAINGPGGIGKTSLALQVLHDLAEHEAFTAILWFSARDIDLDADRGPLAVKPAAQSLSQFARQYIGYVEPTRLQESSEELTETFLRSLSENDVGPILYVFDNFETVYNPSQLFREISDFVRLPNKILITTRHREFKGDWPLDVDGMSRPEFDALVSTSSSRLGIADLFNESRAWLDSLFRESGGHPYVVKVALGEVARSGKTGQKFDRIMASKDEILDALFERSFNRLSPSAQRVFFTLCRWRSLIPSIALEAVLTRPANSRIDVEAALQHLIDSSLIERTYSDVDAESFLHVPAAAYRFGTVQMKFSEISEQVEDDAKYLHLFGAVSDNVAKTGFSSHVHRFYDNAKDLVGSRLVEAIAIGEYVARRYPESWLHLARLQRDIGGGGRLSAKASLQAYLARRPDDADAWLELARVCGETGDDIGELRAASQASQNSERRYAALSSSAAALRERCDSGRIKVDSRQKRSFLVSLCEGWHPRENQASVRDCFNLARLATRADSPEEALFWAERGLRREKNNQRLSEIRLAALRAISGRPL